VKERDLELKVGLLVLCGAAILGAFFYILGDFSLGPGYHLYVDYEFSGNLRAGAPVKVAGIKVGRVVDVSLHGGELDERSGRRVQVRIKVWVQERVADVIREDAEFFVNTSGVLGEQYLEIVPGSRERPALAPDSIAIGVDPPRTDLIIARAYEFLDAVTPVLTENRALIADLLGDSARLVHELNLLLAENHDAIGKLLVSADRLASEGADLLHSVRVGLGDPRILRTTLVDLDGAIVHADQAVVALTPRAIRLADEGLRLTGLLTDERVLHTVGGVDDLVVRAVRILDESMGLLVDVRAGKGTVGQLVARDELYADIREMVRDLKRNPWKLIWKE